MKISVRQLRGIIKEEISSLLKLKAKKAAKKKPVPKVTAAWRNPASGASYLQTSLGGFYFTPYDMMLTPVDPKDVPKNLESWTTLRDAAEVNAMINTGEFADVPGEEAKIDVAKPVDDQMTDGEGLGSYDDR